jgi:hypothetical protein
MVARRGVEVPELTEQRPRTSEPNVRTRVSLNAV